MIHRQPSEQLNTGTTGAYYAHCPCGVCGPLRLTREHAQADDTLHAAVCSSRKAAA